ncbi:MAG TPA: GntR family transcriptional regulator, partial [Albitalea sp.]
MAADRVHDAIYAAVMDHRLAPGTRLREEELAQTFEVSRTLVRQALHRLAQDGVVLLRPNRGAQVPEPTRLDGEHVFDARRVVECEVARRLAGKLSRDQLAELRRLVEAEARALRAGD